MGEEKITFRLSRELYEKAKAKAKAEDVYLAQVLRRCLRQWVGEGEEEQPEGREPEED